MPRFLAILAPVCFLALLFLPAADVLGPEFGGVEIKEADRAHNGLALIVLVLFVSLIVPLNVYFTILIVFVFCIVGLLYRPAFSKLRTRALILAFSTLFAFSGYGTHGRYIGWWLWVFSYLLLTTAHLWPLVQKPEAV